MATEETNVYKWDDKLVLSNPKFGEQLNFDRYDSDYARKVPFPGDYLLANLAYLAYKDETCFLPDDWELLTTASNKVTTNGYFGVAFWNPKLCQIVVAHRGTKKSNIGALITDLLLALNEEKTGQSQSAATFVHLVCDQMQAKRSVDGSRFQLSITGHSLGAWLAQITTFTVKYFKRRDDTFVEDKDYLSNIHPHTVVFESPGCKEAFVKLVRYFVPHYAHRKYGNYNTLDMTVYLSQLNAINSINEHVGTIYIIGSKTHAIKDIINQFDPAGKIEKERVLDFRSGMVASCKSLFKKLVPFSSTKIRKERVKDDEYSLNVFNEKELDFVKDWVHVIGQDFAKVKQFKQKHSLPNFQVDDEWNIIKGSTLHETIACIKRIQPTKTVLLELLKSDADERVHYEIFKLKTEQFERDLLQFQNYYFKDRYRVKEFLASKNQILHIRVDKDSTLEKELETSILNSVFTYYKGNDPTLTRDYLTKNQYGFLEWNKFYQVLHVFPDILGKVNLLVIECFEVENQDYASVLQFLKCSTTKVILLSTNIFSWKEDIPNITEVAGYGNNIQFQDLTDCCQQKFFMQQNLELHGKNISLYDTVKASFPFSSDVYSHLNKAITVDVLLELMLTPITEPIVMDCPFNNLLNGAVFLELHREVNLPKLLQLQHDDQLHFVLQGDENPDFLQAVQSNFENEKINFKIQNNINFMKVCLEDFNKIGYLLTIKNNGLFVTTIFNKNFYISRNIVTNKTVSSFIFEDLNDDFDEYYICGNEKMFKESVSRERRDRFKFVSSAEKAKERMQNPKSSTHLLRIEDDKIEWLYSRGNMDYLRKYLAPEETCIDEMEITREDIVVISGEPGIGKSSTIGLQFLYLHETHWVFAVPLRHAAFTSGPSEFTFDDAAKFILKTCGFPETSCIQHLLAYCLKHETSLPVYLLFDAYDEIQDKDARKMFIGLVNFLKYSSKVKMLITTRKYRCKELENGISVFASHFQTFDSETKAIDFLTNFWNCQLRLFEDFTNVDELQRLARNILQGAEDIFGETISNFIGIPMHLRMIAEVITPNSSAPTAVTQMNILNLYQKYTQNRYDLYFKRSGFTCNETMKKWLSEQISTKLYQLAIMKLLDINIKSVDLRDIEELNNIGIIQSRLDTNLNYEFLHESVRDYFIAYLLKRWLEFHFELFHNNWDIEKFIITDFLLNPAYKEMRFFLNCYLKSSLVASERLEICRSRVKQLWDDDQSQFFFDQESAFHICVREDLCFIMQHFLFQATNNINEVALLCKHNSDLETPLFLAVNKVGAYNSLDVSENSLGILFEEFNGLTRDDTKRILLETLCAYFVSAKHLETINNHSKNCANIQSVMQELTLHFGQMLEFLESCRLNNNSKLNSILERYQNDKITRDTFLLFTNPRKETCLHLTTDKEIVEKLLKLGANKNARDHHGMTPLARAIKVGNTEIAVALIRKGADTGITDYLGNSPLHHAAKYDNFEITKLLLSSKDKKVDVNHANIFRVTPLMLAAKNGNELLVKWFLDKGANVNDADWNGMTPLYHAVKGDHINLVRLLKQKGGDINVQDDFEVTPLLFSIMKRRWNMVTSLLDNGADVNIDSRKHGSPLQLLITMDRSSVIIKILKDTVKVAKGGAPIIVREAAKTDMLTQEEIVYINKLQSAKINKK